MGVFTLSRMCSGSNAKFDRVIVKVSCAALGHRLLRQSWLCRAPSKRQKHRHCQCPHGYHLQ